MKKLFAMFMAMAMMVTMSVTTFAAGTGSITINGVVNDEVTYEIYQLLKLDTYVPAENKYAYSVTSEWEYFFKNDETAKLYFNVAANGTIEAKSTYTEETAVAFAQAALAYAKLKEEGSEEQKIAPVKSSKNPGDFTITDDKGVFSGLDLGYYLVDSTVGALCGLTTTNPDASITAKNGIPTIDKQVLEDSTSQWGDSNTADIGQIVEYRVTINVHAGAENYVLHDTMEKGLTYKAITKIEHVIPGTDTHVVPAEKYTVKTGDDVTDDCSFEVHFAKTFCDELEMNDKLVVYYKAMLNREASIGLETDGNNDPVGNVNTAMLTFGEGNYSNEDSVTTYTYGIDIIKTDSQNTLIDGAEFEIYGSADGDDNVAVVILKATATENEGDAARDSKGAILKFDDDHDSATPDVMVKAGSIVEYRRAREDETGVPIVVNGGKVRVEGFDNGTYYLKETKEPGGYSRLNGRQKFIISDGNLYATFNGDIFSTGSGVHVVNKTGEMLPETGGMGTVMFITCGSVLVMAAGVLLVTKKRMNMIQD